MPLGRRRKRTRRASSSAGAGTGTGGEGASEQERIHVRSEFAEQVMVKREVLATCVTCLLCCRLLRDATTIPECLHTFCRKCIMKKLVDEEEECCPICKIHLGVDPVDKLRADHHLQFIRETVFPLKRKRIISTDENPIPIPNPNPNPNQDSNPNHDTNQDSNSNPLPQIETSNQKVKKERSISSLVARNGNKASRRSVSLSKEKVSLERKGNARKKAKVIEPKQEDQETSPPVMMTYTRRQISSDPEGSNSQTPKKDSEEKTGPFCDKPEIEGPICEIKAETFTIEENKGENQVRLKRKRNKISAQTMVRTRPVWFSLVASPHSEGGSVLPQLTANYLRIKDGNIQVSSVQKYIKNKLGLSSETEVEIMCRGLSIDPSINLHSLINMWIRNESSHKIKTLVGSSAKDFVMVLMYHLKSNLIS